MAKETKKDKVLKLYKRGIEAPAIAERTGVGLRHVYLITAQYRAEKKYVQEESEKLVKGDSRSVPDGILSLEPLN